MSLFKKIFYESILLFKVLTFFEKVERKSSGVVK